MDNTCKVDIERVYSHLFTNWDLLLGKNHDTKSRIISNNRINNNNHVTMNIYPPLEVNTSIVDNIIKNHSNNYSNDIV